MYKKDNSDCVLELSPIVIKSCAGHNSITLFMILDQVVHVDDIE